MRPDSAAQPPSRSHASDLAVTVFACLAFATLALGYVTALRVAVRLAPLADPNAADGRYFAIHGLALVAAAIVGFGLGTYFRGLGFAFAALFIAAMLLVMIGAQVATFELACAGYNDVIRHWQC